MKKTLIAIAALTAFVSNGQIATKLDVADTRAANEAPNFYTKGIRADFKTLSLIGAGPAGYGTSITINPWTNLDNTGGKTHQLHFNNGGFFYRNANPLDPAWGTWKQVITTNDSGNIDLNGTIFAGAGFSVDGQNILSGRYTSGTISNWGSLWSTGASFMAYGLKAKVGSPGGWVSSTPISIVRSAALIDNTGFHIQAGATQSTAEGTEVAVNEYFTVREYGRVGIGTNNPAYKLDVKGDLFSDNHTIESYSPTVFLKRNTTDGGYIQGIQSQEQNGTNNWFSGNLGTSQWRIAKGDYNDAKLIILDTGNIGIGSAQPQTKLDVAGQILAGQSSSTEGVNAFSIRFENNGGNIVNLGSIRSSGSGFIGFGVKASPTVAEGFNSSNSELSLERSALVVGGYSGNALQFFTAPNQQTPNGSPIAMTQVLKISNIGNMALNGKLEAKEIKVTTTPTADFVFEEDYKLPKLEEVEKHIKEKKHLPEIASAKEMEKEGVNVGEFQIKLLQKIEELTLYTIEQNKKIEAQNKQILEQHQRIEKLEKKIKP